MYDTDRTRTFILTGTSRKTPSAVVKWRQKKSQGSPEKEITCDKLTGVNSVKYYFTTFITPFIKFQCPGKVHT